MPIRPAQASRAADKAARSDPRGVAELIASLEVLIADLGALQSPQALKAFELSAVSGCVNRGEGRRRQTRFVRSDQGRHDLTALGAQLAARNAELIRQTKLFSREG